jgi:hypothetical protein
MTPEGLFASMFNGRSTITALGAYFAPSSHTLTMSSSSLEGDSNSNFIASHSVFNVVGGNQTTITNVYPPGQYIITTSQNS